MICGLLDFDKKEIRNVETQEPFAQLALEAQMRAAHALEPDAPDAKTRLILKWLLVTRAALAKKMHTFKTSGIRSRG